MLSLIIFKCYVTFFINHRHKTVGNYAVMTFTFLLFAPSGVSFKLEILTGTVYGSTMYIGIPISVQFEQC